MPARRIPRWTEAEVAVMREHYPVEGIQVAARLPGRSWHSIHVKAHKLGLRSQRVTDAPRAKLRGEQIEEAIRLREIEGWSFARIGAHFGVAETSACNAVLITLCPRKGFRPAERDRHGRLAPQGLERLRYALKKGLKGVDIQLRLGVSAACVAEQRRRYDRELKAAGKARLPQPGAGEMYSGVKLSKAKKAEIEALFMQGLGTAKVSERSGASKTSCTRVRNRLIAKLKRKGETLPGCDAKGKRRRVAESARLVTDQQRDALRALLLDRVPVRRAAALVALGTCSAYRIRDELRAELEARGEELPAPQLPGRVRYADGPDWPPRGPEEMFAFRAMLADKSFDDAKAEWRRLKREERLAEAARPRSFEEQLARIGRGEIGVERALERRHLEPSLADTQREARAA